MLRFKDFSLRSKQIAALGLVLAIVAVASLYALSRLQLMKNDVDEVSKFWLSRAETVGLLAINVALVRLNQVQMAATTDHDRRRFYAERAVARLDSVSAYWDRFAEVRLDSLGRQLDETELYWADQEQATTEALEDSWDTYLGELLFFLDPDEELDEETRIRIFDASEDDFRAVAENIGDLYDINEGAWEVSERRADTNFENARWVTRLLFVGAILIALVIIILLVRSIATPIVALTRAAEKVANGDRSVRLTADSKDEIGRLSRSFNYMTISLREQEEEILRRQAELEEKNAALETALEKLQTTQQQLIVREKMASLGQLTAGIAHEIKNPLNFVNNFARLSRDLMEDLEEDLRKNPDKSVRDLLPDIEDLLSDLNFNADRIGEHGARADSIVRNMLLHSRGKPGERSATDINELLEEYTNLAYHGMRGADSKFYSEVKMDFGEDVGNLSIVSQNIGRVFLNVLNNAFYAVDVRRKNENQDFEPTVIVRSRRTSRHVEISIEDNGDGIPPDMVDRVFEPFFTTKPTGSGTGLGLSLAYDIVTEEHGGEMTLQTEVGKGTTFVIKLPTADSSG